MANVDQERKPKTALDPEKMDPTTTVVVIRGNYLLLCNCSGKMEHRPNIDVLEQMEVLLEELFEMEDDERKHIVAVT